MKILRKLSSILLLALAFVMPTVNAATDSFSISASNLKFLYGINYLGNDSTLNFTYKTNNNGDVVYCTEIHDTMTDTEETYTYSREASDSIAYVLENGYPSKTITGDNYKDYYITGLAIWYLISPNDSTFTYFDLSAGTYKGASSGVVGYVAKLVNGAKNYKTTTPTLKVSNPSTTLTLNSDKSYYVSNSISVSTTGNVGDYTVSLNGAPSNTKVEKNGNSFIVKVPASNVTSNTSFTVDVTATGTTSKALVYSPVDASHQSLVKLGKVTTNLNDSTKLSLTKETKTGTVKISKLDIANDKEVKGATLVVKDSKGNVIDEWVSDGNVHIIENLAIGTYTLTETIAPDGYVLNEETVTFTITEDKLETSAVMYNSMKEVTKVKISKQDITTKEELPGATLTIKDKNGKVVETWVSGKTPHYIEGLDAGDYTLTETTAPEGYELSSETIKFTVKSDGSVTSVVMYNARYTEVPITDLDVSTGTIIGAAVLVLLGTGLVFYAKRSY